MEENNEEELSSSGLQHIKDLENFIKTYTEQIEFAKERLEETKKNREKALNFFKSQKDQPSN